jgi:hypothetical protein
MAHAARADAPAAVEWLRGRFVGKKRPFDICPMNRLLESLPPWPLNSTHTMIKAKSHSMPIPREFLRSWTITRG